MSEADVEAHVRATFRLNWRKRRSCGSLNLTFRRKNWASIAASTSVTVGVGDAITPEHRLELFGSIKGAQLCRSVERRIYEPNL
jgi:hypothetical protein